MVPLSSFPALYFIYEWLVRGENIFTIETHLPSVRALDRCAARVRGRHLSATPTSPG